MRRKRSISVWRRVILAVVCVLLAGCTLAPRYERPAAPVPPEWPAGPAYQEARTSPSDPEAPEMPWREFIPDARLQHIIGIALDHNRDFRIAALNVERARAYYGIQRASLLPTVNAVGSGFQERVPADLSSSRSVMTSEKYSVNLGVSSWEIDFFGRIRSLKDAALDEYLATEQARRSAQILLVSAVADAYFGLAADRENLKLATSTLEAQEAAYRLIRKRFEAGIVSELDLRQAQSQVETARRDVSRYTQVTAQDENALNLLAGSPLSPELLPSHGDDVRPPREVSAGLSSELLLRRPDVLAAEHRLKAANANIGAARAAFFPRVSLTAAVGTASADLSGLFKSGQGTWSFAPQIVMPIFDARTWSAYDVAKAERDILVAQYEKAVQNAFREVADVLAARGTLNGQIEAQQSLVEALSAAYRLSHARYTKGIDSYLSVLVAQRSLYAAQQVLISLRLAGISNRIAVYRVLGGGNS